jgi:surface antigen
MYKKLITLPIVVTVFLSGCATGPNKQQIGGLGGAGLGGIAGALACKNVGKGTGNKAAIAACTLLGAGLGYIAGSSIGSSLDATDQMNARTALENNQPTTWTNPNTNAQYTVTPTVTTPTSNGGVCREYTTEAVVDGRRERVYGKACRQPDGTWQDMGR